MTSTLLVFSHTLWAPKIFPDFESELLIIFLLGRKCQLIPSNCEMCPTVIDQGSVIIRVLLILSVRNSRKTSPLEGMDPASLT